MVIYEKPNYVQVVYHPDKDFIVFDWTDFRLSLIQVQELADKTLLATRKNRCYYYIADTSKVHTVLSSEVLQWWGEVGVPRLAAAGVKAIVTVIPTSILATLSTRDWQAQMINSITMQNVKSFTEAETVIKELQSLMKEED